MAKRRIDKNTVCVDDGSDSVNGQGSDNTSSTNLTTKLERRRRIEEITEERRLRTELFPF